MTETIAVLGTGKMGSALARNFVAIGRKVVLGSREAVHGQAVAEQIQAQYLDANLTAATYEDAADLGKIVILAVPFSEAAGILTGLRTCLAGKVVVDITNPFGAAPVDTSGAEMHARLLLSSTSLVAAWKTNFWKLLDPQIRADAVQDCFLCGDDEDARHLVARLITETGFRPVDCGQLANARVLDAMVPLMLELDDRYKSDFKCGWKLLL